MSDCLTGFGWKGNRGKGLNNGNLADVKVVESEIVDRAESADTSRESKILDSYEPVDHSKSLIAEVLIEPFGGTIGDHSGVDEAMEMICQGLCWWRFQCSTLGHWEWRAKLFKTGVGKTQWRCQCFGVSMDSRQGIRGPCLMKEVMGWTTTIGGGSLSFTATKRLT